MKLNRKSGTKIAMTAAALVVSGAALIAHCLCRCEFRDAASASTAAPARALARAPRMTARARMPARAKAGSRCSRTSARPPAVSSKIAKIERMRPAASFAAGRISQLSGAAGHDQRKASLSRLWLGAQASALSRDPRRLPRRRLVRDHLRELHDRGRPAALHARPHPRALSAGDARRLALDCLHRAARPGLSRRAEKACRARRSEMDLRSSLLDRRARGEPARPPAHPLHRGSARPRRRPCRPGSGHSRTPADARERVELCHLRPIRDDRMGVRERGGAARRLLAPVRRQQRLCQRLQPRLLHQRLPARRAARSGRPVPCRRPQPRREPHHRHPRPSRVRRGVGFLPRDRRPFRPGFDHDRARRQHPAARRACRRARPCARRSPARCADGKRLEAAE